MTQTREGKQHMSTYLVKNVTKLNVGKQIVLDIDSELHISQCTCKETHCTCKYANPLRCYFDNEELFVQSENMEKLQVQQSKGEAETAQIDWLIQYLPVLNKYEMCLSIVYSGDIDVLILHMFTLSYL